MTHEEYETDQAKHDAYVKSVESDNLLAAGRIDEARLRMEEAAGLDKAYAVRAVLFGRKDARKIQVSTAVRKLIIPFLAKAGFEVKAGGSWSEGKFLIRRKNNAEHAVLIGRDKFGNRLGVLAARTPASGKCEYFDWRTLGIRSDSLAYKTQEELEAVCAWWCELIGQHVFPWWDER